MVKITLPSGNIGGINEFSYQDKQGASQVGCHFSIGEYTGKDSPTFWRKCVAFGDTARAVIALGKGAPIVLLDIGLPEYKAPQKINVGGEEKWLAEETSFIVNRIALDQWGVLKNAGDTAPAKNQAQQAAPTQQAAPVPPAQPAPQAAPVPPAQPAPQAAPVPPAQPAPQAAPVPPQPQTTMTSSFDDEIPF